jgi:hypothetical protein
MSVLGIVQPKLHSLTVGLFANWLPNNMVAVGDFGIIRNCKFERYGSLREYGAAFDVDDHDASKTNFEYKDKIKLDFNASVAVDAGAGQSAKIILTMTDRGAFLYHLSKMMIQRPKSSRQFNEQVAAALIDPAIALPKNVVLVTEVHHAGKATIVVSDSSDCSLDIQTGFAPGGEAFLSGAKGKVKVGNSRGSVFNFIAQDDIVAFLKIVRPTTPPPGGGGPAANAVARSIDWVREWIASRRLEVPALKLRYVEDSPQPEIAVSDSQGREFARIAMADVTAQEMAATDEEVAVTANDEIKVAAQQFGTRYAAR